MGNKESKEEQKPNLQKNELSKSTPSLATENTRQRKVLKIGRIQVSIIQGKITEEKADVIVNSVDHDLDLSKGRGSKVIVEDGGDSIQRECSRNYPKGISENDVAVTGGGNLKCQKVYHVTLPKYNGSNQSALSLAVTNCLTEAGQNRFTSLVFPPFGSGFLGYPDKDIADSMLQAVVDYEKSNKSTRIQSLVIVICHRSQTPVYKDFERKARLLSGNRGGKAHVGHSIVRSCECGNIEVIIKRGTLTKQRCDVMVATASKDLNLKHGILSKSVLEAAGPDIQKACDNNYPSGVDMGEVAAVRGYNLPCRFVYFGCLPEWNSTTEDPQQVLSDFVTACLEKADSYNVKYMAFPTLGTGGLKYPPHIMAETVKECIETFDLLHQNSELRHIFIVIYSQGRDCDAIEKALLQEFSNFTDMVTPSAPPPPIEPSAPPLSPTPVTPAPGTPAFHMWMYKYNDRPPNYWSIYSPQKKLKEWSMAPVGQKKYSLVSVSGRIRDAVTKLVEETWLAKYIGHGRDAAGLDDLGYTKIKVVNVERIENPELYEKYTEGRGKLFRKAGVLEEPFDQLEEIGAGRKKWKVFTSQKVDNEVLTDVYPEINEHYLFHGTREDRIDIIATQGFDLTRADKSMFGAAIYAAESSTKSDQYADDKSARDKDSPKKMILLRMALGEIYVTEKEQKFTRPPCKTCKNDKCTDSSHNSNGFGFYDSIVVDGQWNFREFIVYDSKQCYPEYVITYKRV